MYEISMQENKISHVRIFLGVYITTVLNNCDVNFV